MSAKKKKPKIVGIEFPGPEGSATISLTDSEELRLREMAMLLQSNSPELQERGEVKLKELAERLAKERAQAVAQKRDSDLGAAKRREAGQYKADKVREATRKGSDPLTLVSERQLRRIKNRSK